jgi:hypothetical protein
VYSLARATKTPWNCSRCIATIVSRGRILGGVPKNPELIEGWLRTKAGVTDQEELRQMMLRTLYDMGQDVDSEWTFEQAVAASKKVASSKQTTGFKTDKSRDADGQHFDGNGIYLESRNVKAGLKENISILYAGERVGKTSKGAKNYAAERVFVAPARLYLRDVVAVPDEKDLRGFRYEVREPKRDPDGIEMMIGHVSSPQGPRSTLTYHEFVENCAITFIVMVMEDSIDAKWWPRIWTSYENNGIGACRSQGFGQFEIEQWDSLGHPTPKQYEEIMLVDQLRLSEQDLTEVDLSTELANGALTLVGSR